MLKRSTMRTPSRYGKRQRLANHHEVVWDEAIDVMADKDSQADRGKPTTPSSSMNQDDFSHISLHRPSQKRRSNFTNVSDMEDSGSPMIKMQSKYGASDQFIEPPTKSSDRQVASPSKRRANTTSLRCSSPVRFAHKSRQSPSSASVSLSDGRNKSSSPEVVSETNMASPRQFQHYGLSDKIISHDAPSPGREEAILLTLSSAITSGTESRSEKKTNERAKNTHTGIEGAKTYIAERQIRQPLLQDAMELDLEPILRPLTPPLRSQVADHFSPHISPASKDIFRVFDVETTLSPKRSRRLFTLMKSDTVPYEEDVSSSPSRKAQEVVEMVETAEGNLNKFFQSLHDESSQIEQQCNDTEDAKDDHLKQDYKEVARPARSTYSKQRSFLMEEPKALDILQPENPRQSESTIDAVLNTETPTDESKSVRNVHDLRHRGEHKRFIDDMSYLLEGLGSSDTAQSTLLELAHKLASKAFAKKFATHHNAFNIVAQLSCVADPVSLAASLTIITVLNQSDMVTKECKITEELVERSMNFDKDLTYYSACKTWRVAKTNQEAVTQLRDDLAHSKALKAYRGVCVSPRLLGLMTAAACSHFSTQHIIKIGFPVLFEPRSAQAIPLELFLAATLIEGACTSGTVSLSTKDIDNVSTALLRICSMQYTSLKSTTISSLLRLLIHSETTNASGIDASGIRALSSISFIAGLVDFVLVTPGEIEDSREDLVLGFGLLVSLMEDSLIARDLVNSKCRFSEGFWIMC